MVTKVIVFYTKEKPFEDIRTETSFLISRRYLSPYDAMGYMGDVVILFIPKQFKTELLTYAENTLIIYYKE